MAKSTMIEDVREAKTWLDHQAAGLDALAQLLRAVEKEYGDRIGQFATVPREPPPEVNQAIATAANEPGKDLLNETRSCKAG